MSLFDFWTGFRGETPALCSQAICERYSLNLSVDDSVYQ